MISPLKRFLAAVAADLGHTTSEVIFGENNTEKEMDTGSPTLQKKILSNTCLFLIEVESPDFS